MNVLCGSCGLQGIAAAETHNIRLACSALEMVGMLYYVLMMCAVYSCGQVPRIGRTS